MKKISLISTIIVLFFELPALAGNELWNDMGASTKVGNDTTVSLKLGQKLTDFKTLYFYDFKPNAKYKLSDLLDIIGGYRFERVKGKTWGNQHRLEGGANVKWAMGDFKFNDANQMEFINPPTGKVQTNYKNKLSASYIINITEKDFKITAWDELYFGFNKTEFNRNRLSIGASTAVMQGLDLSLGYMYESKKSGTSWSGTNVLMTDLTYAL